MDETQYMSIDAIEAEADDAFADIPFGDTKFAPSETNSQAREETGRAEQSDTQTEDDGKDESAGTTAKSDMEPTRNASEAKVPSPGEDELKNLRTQAERARSAQAAADREKAELTRQNAYLAAQLEAREQALRLAAKQAGYDDNTIDRELTVNRDHANQRFQQTEYQRQQQELINQQQSQAMADQAAREQKVAEMESKAAYQDKLYNISKEALKIGAVGVDIETLYNDVLNSPDLQEMIEITYEPGLSVERRKALSAKIYKMADSQVIDKLKQIAETPKGGNRPIYDRSTAVGSSSGGRSTSVTYTDEQQIYDDIDDLYANTPMTQKNKR